MIKLTNVRSRDWTGPVSILFQAEQNLFGLGTFLVPVPVRDAAVQAKQATHYLQLSSPEAIGADQRSVMPSIHHLHRQDKTVLSCPRWQYEQNWQQIKTVGNRIFRNWMFFLPFCPVSKFGMKRLVCKRVHTTDGTGQNWSVSNIVDYFKLL